MLVMVLSLPEIAKAQDSSDCKWAYNDTFGWQCIAPGAQYYHTDSGWIGCSWIYGYHADSPDYGWEWDCGDSEAPLDANNHPLPY
jgi:hypothetical protein